MSRTFNCRRLSTIVAASLSLLLISFSSADDEPHSLVGKFDWPQLGGTPHRNNVTTGNNIPTEWDVETGKNIKWVAELGSQSYGNIVVANGHVYVGTNNHRAYLERYPNTVDLGVLLCFRESDGKFLWQHSSEKLRTGRVHDWPNQGICSAPIVQGDRLWFVTSRGEVRCLDSEGFLDNENDGPYTDEPVEDPDEADVVWSFDMMQELGVSQHNMATCAPTIWGDTLFICTSNGVDESHINLPAPEAPSFMAMDKHTGKVLWTDNSPGENILHGQWSCPAIGVFDGVPQVLFPGGDGWLYSFHAGRWKEDGTPILLWKFDGNPKESLWQLGGSGTRNNMIAVPVIDDGLVYVAMGQDPEHGDGQGHLWCIDPTKRGDVSQDLVVDESGHVVPHRRIIAIVEWEKGFSVGSGEDIEAGLDDGEISDNIRTGFQQNGVQLPEVVEVLTISEGREWRVLAEIDNVPEQFRVVLSINRLRRAEKGRTTLTAYRRTSEKVIANPNSAVVWHFSEDDTDGDGDIDKWEETFNRTIASPTIKNDLLVIPDHAGFVHCFDAKTGERFWVADLIATCWASPMIVDNTVFVGDEDGDVAIFKLSPDRSRSIQATQWKDRKYYEPAHEILMPNSIYMMPVVANNTLYIATKNRLYAIAAASDSSNP